MQLFRRDNTYGYTDKQLQALNEEFSEYVAKQGVEPYTDEYEQAACAFCDWVARRTPGI